MSKSVSFSYGRYQLRFEIEGDTFYGEDYVLLDRDDDLTADLPWSDLGYTVEPFLDPEEFIRLKQGIRRILQDLVEQVLGHEVPVFRMEHYHRYIDGDEARHRAFLSKYGGCFPIERFPISARTVEDRVSAICKKPLTLRNYQDAFPPEFCVRVVRPSSTDNNPLHRDVWLGRLRHAVNIYAALAGSTEDSSLPLVAGSHRWKESEIERTNQGATVNGRSFTVPAVTGARRPIELIRPNPGENEIMVFSPYLIHGGGVNRNPDETRVSLEMRFWRASDRSSLAVNPGEGASGC